MTCSDYNKLPYGRFCWYHFGEIHHLFWAWWQLKSLNYHASRIVKKKHDVCPLILHHFCWCFLTTPHVLSMIPYSYILPNITVFLPPDGRSSTKTSLKDACNTPLFLYSYLWRRQISPIPTPGAFVLWYAPKNLELLSSMVNEAEWNGNDPNWPCDPWCMNTVIDPNPLCVNLPQIHSSHLKIDKNPFQFSGAICSFQGW